MKPLFLTASAVALMMIAAACTDAKTNAQTASYEPPAAETPAATPDTYADNYDEMSRTDIKADDTADQRSVFMLASNEVLASDLIGASVQNPAGEDIATVADVWVGEKGDTPKLIVREGGVAGVGGTLHAISFDDARIEPVAGESEPEVRVTYSEASMESLPAFEQDGLDDYRLASEIMGTTASFAFNDDTARVNDFILADDGRPEYAVVSEGLAGMDQYVIDADALRVEQGDGGSLVIDMDEDAFARAKVMDQGQ